MNASVDLVAGHTYHGRKGGVRNAFRYSVDYLLFDAEAEVQGPGLFSRNRRNLVAVHDTDHGGAPGAGDGPEWVRSVLAQHQLPQPAQILLLAQPRVLGHVFNPVSFWLCYDSENSLVSVIAEVTNTFGERHSYLCHHPDRAPIRATDRLSATKIHFVSPFQPVAGGYTFRFDIRADKIGINIDYTRKGGGLIATLTGARVPLTNRRILGTALRRPFGSRRVWLLIHWQALKLWWKGVRYRVHPTPPATDVSRG